MNESNVNKLVSFIQQFADVQPIEVSMQKALQSGYTMSECKEALSRLGMSPIAIPAYKEPRAFPRLPVMIIGSIIGASLLGTAAYLQFYAQKPSSTVQNARTGSQPDIATASAGKVGFPTVSNSISPVRSNPTKTVTPLQTSAEDPIKLMKEALHSADYKFTNDRGAVPDSSAIEIIDDQSSTTLGDVTIYTKKGAVARLEAILSAGPPAKTAVYIFKENDFYLLYPEDKKYYLSSDSSLGESLLYLFLPALLISQSEKDGILWTKVGDNEWTSKWKNELGGNRIAERSPTIKIALDPTTHLLHRVWMNSDPTQPWQFIEYTIDPISDIEALLTIPPDYTEVQLGVSPTP